ncbi:MAG TPA: sugar MFS transporter [Chitinophaga sp.]|uniref:sugar MFS transporter n=1 Tax=Chitinophaga sp. TaxID=1869181 RepID=UPI002F925685
MGNTHAGTLRKREVAISLVIIGMLFFVFGFVSWVNAILIPYFRIACELTHFESYLVTFAFYIAYLVMSVPSAYLIRRLGFKKGIMAGFWVMAAGALLFIPAALYRTYPLFLTGLFTIGLGLAVLQTAANPYVTILGKPERAAQRISIMGIFNKGAGIIAPLVLGAVVLRADDSALFAQLSGMADDVKAAFLDALIRRVIPPYTIITIVLFLLGLTVRYSALPEINTEVENEELAVANAGKKSILQFPHLILGAVAIFLHVGTQVIAVDTIIGYADSMGLSLQQAKVFPSFTLFATITGYVIGIVVIPRWVSQLHALQFCTLLGSVLTCCILLLQGRVQLFGYSADISLWFVVLLGLANSLVWAGIWPWALKDLGRYTKLGASVMIMGLCGNAILPLIYGRLADLYSVRAGYIILLPCYMYLVFYAFKGYRIKTWNLLKR